MCGNVKPGVLPATKQRTVQSWVLSVSHLSGGHSEEQNHSPTLGDQQPVYTLSDRTTVVSGTLSHLPEDVLGPQPPPGRSAVALGPLLPLPPSLVAPGSFQSHGHTLTLCGIRVSGK